MSARPLPGSARTENRKAHEAGERQRPRSGAFWLATSPAIVRHALRTVPWATLLAGCATGTVLLAALGATSRTPLDQATVRLTFLPAVAALAFVPRTPSQALAQAAPLPAWVAPVAQTLLAVPAVAITCWAQLLIMSATVPAGSGPPPAIYPLIAQLTGWAAVGVAAAVVCDRSRYSDLGGAMAAPVTLVVVAIARVTPGLKDGLALPPPAPRTATIAWFSVATGALAITMAGLRDRWHRYTGVYRGVVKRHHGQGP